MGGISSYWFAKSVYGAEYLHTKYDAHNNGDNLQSLSFLSTNEWLNLVEPLLLIVLINDSQLQEIS